MSLSPTAQRAIEWLEQQVADLGGIRNATARDPIFKNWRQATLTTLQRIWPGEQPRLERFLRIPFSPVDPRADLRVMREWYSRGCQEAIRVLNAYVAEIRANGVPEPRAEDAEGVPSGEFAADFPTVSLPPGDLGSAPPLTTESSNTLAEFVDSSPQASGANVPAPPSLHVVEGKGRPGLAPRDPEGGGSPAPRRGPPALNRPDAASAPPAAPVSEPTPATAPASRVIEKGQGMMAKLRELLGLVGGPAKSPTPPRESPSREIPVRRAPGESPSREMRLPENLRERAPREKPREELPPAEFPSLDLPPGTPAPPSRGLDIVALGDPVTRPPGAPASGGVAPPSAASADVPAHESDPQRPGAWPLPRTTAPEAQSAGTPAAGSPPDAPPATTAGSSPSGSGAQPAAGSDAAHDADTARREPGMSVVMSRPTTLRGTIEKVSIESLISKEFRGASSREPSPNAPAAPGRPAVAPPAAQPPAGPPVAASDPSDEFLPGTPVEELLAGAPPPAGAKSPPTVPVVPPAPTAAENPPPATRSNVVPMPAEPRATQASRPVKQEAGREPPDPGGSVESVDPEVLARATESFMRSSPVLGATGRRVKRERDVSEYEDPDAIAVASMVEDLGRLGVPTGRHNETRARLLDLARRIEKGELEWTVLKKSVWFAMDYPELARRLVPILLPWFDRAA